MPSSSFIPSPGMDQGGPWEQMGPGTEGTSPGGLVGEPVSPTPTPDKLYPGKERTEQKLSEGLRRGSGWILSLDVKSLSLSEFIQSPYSFLAPSNFKKNVTIFIVKGQRP